MATTLEAQEGTLSLELSTLSSQTQACSLLMCSIEHIFFAKGQINEPIAVLRTKRARERLAEAQRREHTSSLAEAANRSSTGQSFSKRRRIRKLDQLLIRIQRMNQQLITAMQGLKQDYPAQKNVDILVRFGSSRLTCRQQLRISLQDVLLRPLRESALQDAKVRRQKMSNMERKLVRFLLGLANEDEDFATFLNSPLALTKAHLFLLAPSEFTCRGWSRQRSLKLPETRYNESDQLGKERDTSSHQASGSVPTYAPQNTKVLSNPFKTSEVCNVIDDTDDDLDTRRLKRLQARALNRTAISDTIKVGGKQEKLKTARKLRKRQPPSASFAIQCGAVINGESSVPPSEMHWFACKVNLKSIAQ